MSADPSRDERIRNLAAEFIVRREAGWSPDDAAEFALWRAADPAHDAAVLRIEATQTLLSRLPETPAAAAMLRELDSFEERRVARFPTWARWITVTAAAACLALVAWVAMPSRGTVPVVLSAAGQTRLVDLSDGSTLQMSAASAVEVLFQADERRINLRHGAVQFSVAKDALRPFVVHAGKIAVRAVGTAFKVSYSPALVEVAVTEGKVRVTSDFHSAPAGQAPVFLVAGEHMTFGAELAGSGTVASPNRSAAPTSVHAPRLEFANTPLSQVVERFNQYSRVQIELGDPDLAARPVGGTFDADQADVFVNLLAAAGDVQVDRVSETHVILRKAR